MGRCGCSMLPGSLTVVAVPSASTVKDMVPPPKNLVVSVLSCIHCRRGHQKSSRLRALVPLPFIPFCGVIGHALSLAEPGSGGYGATWSRWKPNPFRHLSARLPQVATEPPGHGGSPTRFATSLHAFPSLACTASALANDVATTARAQWATTCSSTRRDYHLWTLTRVCPEPRFASRLS